MGEFKLLALSEKSVNSKIRIGLPINNFFFITVCLKYVKQYNNFIYLFLLVCKVNVEQLTTESQEILIKYKFKLRIMKTKYKFFALVLLFAFLVTGIKAIGYGDNVYTCCKRNGDGCVVGGQMLPDYAGYGPIKCPPATESVEINNQEIN
jgi:hypothetical protein